MQTLAAESSRVSASPQKGVQEGSLESLLLLIHYVLPVMLGWSLARVIKQADGGDFSHSGLILLLAGIGAAYSFDRIVDSPYQHSPRWLRISLWITLSVSAGMILTLAVTGRIGMNVLETLAALSIMTLLYPLLKRLPLAKTLLVALCWIWACAALPLSEGAGHWLSLDVTLPLFLMISAGCILCDLKDLQEDRRKRIPSLPALLGIRASSLIATGLALGAAVLAFHHHRFGLTTGALLLAASAQFPSFLMMKSIGPILIDSILIIPGVLIAMGVV